MASGIADTPLVSYSQQYKNFIENTPRCLEFKEKYNSVITNMNTLYNPLFHIMDIAQSQNLPCVLKDIMDTLPEFDVLKTVLNNQNLDEDFDGLLDEMQKDVNLILEKGFPAFEIQLLNLFAEIEHEESKLNDLIEKINKCTNEIKNLCADTILENKSN
jgi:hypothetical protein